MSVTREDFVAQEAFKRLDAIGNQLATTVPTIWNKMVMLTQAESIACLAVGGICLVAALIALACFVKIKVPSGYDWPINKVVSLVFCAGFIPAGITLLYPWNWVGAFAPEARLIARLIGAITQSGTN